MTHDEGIDYSLHTACCDDTQDDDREPMTRLDGLAALGLLALSAAVVLGLVWVVLA